MRVPSAPVPAVLWPDSLRGGGGVATAVTVASELFCVCSRAVPSLCCVMSTMLSIGQPVELLKCLVTVAFATSPLRLGLRTRFFKV